MKTRQLDKVFQTITELPFSNLFVSGSSFTYNNSEKHRITWPYYLQDLGNINQVYDSSMPGAGNYHIAFSLIWTLENIPHTIDDTLVIVMFSANDQDDCIIDKDSLNDYPWVFNYSESVVTGISGGSNLGNTGNHECRCMVHEKTNQSRAIENFLYKIILKNYLENKKYNFLLLDYMHPNSVARDSNFNMHKYLNKNIKNKLSDLSICNEYLYDFVVKHDLLDDDNYHPSPQGHLEWTKQCLMPTILKKFVD